MQLTQARPTMHCIHLVYNWGERERTPHLWIKRKIVYICIYVYIYIWYVRTPYMHSALFVQTAMLYMSKDIPKLAMFESQKEVCMTHL